MGHTGVSKIYPQVPGDEIADLVKQVGKNVTKFKVGDREGATARSIAVNAAKSSFRVTARYFLLTATLTDSSQAVSRRADTLTIS